MPTRSRCNCSRIISARHHDHADAVGPAGNLVLVSAALAKRPAIIAPFVTRPAEMVLDRAALGLPPASAAAQGVYRLRAARWLSQGTIVLQGTGVTNAFLNETLPLLERENWI